MPRHIADQTLTFDFESKTVTGFLGHLAVIGISETYISLRGRGEDSDLVGFLIRPSGEARLAQPQARLRPQLPEPAK